MECDSLESFKSSLGAYKTIFLFLNSYNFEVSAQTFKKELESLGQTLRDIPSITVTLQPSKNLQSFSNIPITPKKTSPSPYKRTTNDSKSKKIEQTQVIYVPECEIIKENQTQTIIKEKEIVVAYEKEKFAEYDILKAKFVELQKEHQKLITVTSELTTALQLNVIGQTKNIHKVIDQCKLVFPSLFTSNENLEKLLQAQKNLAKTGDACYSPNSRQRSVSPHRRLTNTIEEEEKQQNIVRPGENSPRPPRKSNDVTSKTQEYLAPSNREVTVNYVQEQRQRTNSNLKISKPQEYANSKTQEYNVPQDVPVSYAQEHRNRSTSKAREYSPSNDSKNNEITVNYPQEHRDQKLKNVSTDDDEKLSRNVVSPLNLEQLNSSEEENTHLLTPETVRRILDSVLRRIFQDGREENSRFSSPIRKDQIEEIVTTAIAEVLDSPKSVSSQQTSQTKKEPKLKNTKPQERKSDDQPKTRTVGFFEIDYKKLRNDLMNCSNEKALRILQALRWRITRSNTSERNKILSSYIENDFLGLQNRRSIPEYFLEDNTQIYIQDSVCRLLNTVASLREGRDYLLSDETLLKRTLLPKIRKITNMPSAIVRNMLIATLQKLSIRKQPRTLMVNEGLLELLVDYLDEFHDKLPRYCLEYCSALVMNLCLVPDAKWRAGKMPKKIVRLLQKFLGSSTTFCLPYVNGIMFSLFENDEVIWEAKNQNIEDLITDVQKRIENENIKSQLDFVVKFRLAGNETISVEEDADEHHEEVDLLEVELDEEDYLTNSPSGEELLEEYKILANKSQKPVSAVASSHSDHGKTRKIEAVSSSRSFCEETLQYYHKPSAEKGIFEKNKFKKLRGPLNVPRTYARQEPGSSAKHFKRTVSTTVCYLEPLTKSPLQNKYKCGCYDEICKEIAEDELSLRRNNAGDNEGVNAKIDFKSLATRGSRRPYIKHIGTMERLLSPSRVSTRNFNKGSLCSVCGEKICDCAFEPRPKLNRTPPSNNR